MPMFQWEESFSVGISAMDSEHKKLIDIINMLYDGMKAGKSKDILEKVFNDLVQYTKVHFTDEEDLMRKNGYPELSVQQTQHRALEDKVQEQFNKFKGGAILVSVELMSFLKDWLVNHIQVHDKKYGVYLNGKGIK